MGTKYDYPTVEAMTLDLLEHFEDATAKTELQGRTWYRESRRVARRLQREHGVTLAQAAGILAALSPQVQWPVNIRLAEQVCATGWTQEGCLGLSERRAHAIWTGERPLSVLGGPKVRAFYRAIMGDHDSAVVDTWMLYAVKWPTRDVSARRYEDVAAAIRKAAQVANTRPADLQAVVWVHVRGGDKA